MPDFTLDVPSAYGTPLGSGLFKHRLEDFQVDEILGFEPSGTGEHLFLFVRKAGQNTQWVARQIAQRAEVPASAVSYSGLKDRQGICTQWFSIHLPGCPDPDFNGWDIEGVTVLKGARHHKKLKVGTHRKNTFKIVIREMSCNGAELEERLQAISNGVPNYFGPQRFGHHGGNLDKALDLFQSKIRVKRSQRGIYLSAARAWLFNQVLAERVRAESWNRYIEGDVLGFCDSGSIIQPDRIDASCKARVESGDLVPTGPLWGRGTPLVEGSVASLERAVVEPAEALANGLEKAGLKQERRVLLLKPEQLEWRFVDDSCLELSFSLPRGAFATSVLHELFGWLEASEIQNG